jgi:mono/diheme cytochrome c family protein
MRCLRIVVVVLAALSSTVGPVLGQTFGNPTHFTEQGGAAVYGAVCAACHMRDGRGAEGAGRYPSLAGNARLQEPGYAVALILRGQRAMPSFAHMLTDEQIADVVAYIQTHFGNTYTDAPTASEVKTARPSD